MSRRVVHSAHRAHRSIGGFGGNLAPAVHGAIAGVISQFGSKYLGAWGAPASVGAVGYVMNNPTLLTLAGMQAASLVNVGGVLGGTTASSGGGYL